MSYMYVTQNETPYRLSISKKSIKETLLEICWNFNFFHCKKICKKLKQCESYILVCCKFKEQNTAIENIKQLPAQKITIWKKLTGCIVIQQEITNSTASSIQLDFVQTKDGLKWIKTWTKQQKCTSCGRIYVTSHTCDYNRSSFYYNQIASSKKYWESIQFQPIGETENTFKLFLVYDIETYTLAESEGINLQPCLLCFTIFGEQELTKIAMEEINRDRTITHSNDNIFYWHSKTKNFISQQFRLLRENILNRMIQVLTTHILSKENKEVLDDFIKLKKLQTYKDIDISKEKNLLLSLTIKPIFLEFYVVGHNIQSFDEILLATQILQPNKFQYEPFLTISRNFMPRQGKILFNDITITFPNPEYHIADEGKENKTAEIIADAREGKPNVKNIKHLYVKSMVRDTFQITHSSLKTAAEAYNLPTSKGCCPFKAINDFYSLGSYRGESETNFPVVTYWSCEDEYKEQLEIWKQKQEKNYDIVKELIEYCCRDVLVTVSLTKCLLETFNSFVTHEFNLNCTFNIFKRPTISSNSHAIFRQIHYKEYGNKLNQLPDIYAPSEEMYEFIRKSVRGGRCYPTFLGRFAEKLYVYDICGMYASALTHPLPYGTPVGKEERDHEIKKFNQLLSSKDEISYFADIKPMIVCINAFPPPPELLDPLPPLCSKASGKLCWTNEPLHKEIVTSIDIITLHNRRWSVSILQHPLNTVFSSWKTCCSNYVKANIQAKEKASKEKNPVKRAISKLLSNALYGSFATKEDNDMVIFEQSLTDKIKHQISQNELQITNITSIPTEQLPSTCYTNIQYFLKSKLPDHRANQQADDELTSPFEAVPEEQPEPSFCSTQTHMTTYKPFNILDVTSDNLTIYMLKSTKPHPTNKRYPTQLASFVLAWTRAFISEWAEILYHDENNIPIENKSLKAIYGDTDSLFLTEAGHRLMLSKGNYRLKSDKTPLIFNPEAPKLTWAVECETECNVCKKPGFCPDSIFLAPKLYALKKIFCPSCNTEFGGKLRAKGHATTHLTFEILLECFNCHKTCSGPARKFTTERRALKRTIHKPYGQFSPFTIHEINLIRELRPWHDPTLVFITDKVLIPYDLQHRNPRVTAPILIEEFEDE
ncbi:DNA polymerase [Great tit adenovirus 1]|uniref:DNA polymerase n=2 Tax=Siadenovirus TaxID=129876 RepID=D0QX11_9ADEN|nr:DNA polymerase [Great tit adenovirus 1]ACW84422.1 DNA polymerase [Great tit adenovirus 1]